MVRDVITEHRLPLRDSRFQFSGEVDWRPAPWPRPLRLAVLAIASGLFWATLIILAILVVAK